MNFPDFQSYLDPLIGDASIRGGLLFLVAAVFVVYILAKEYRAAKLSSLRKENSQRALYFLDRLIRRDPTNAMAYWQKGQVYEVLGMHDQAIHYYQAAHSVNSRAYSTNEVSDAFERMRGPRINPRSQKVTSSKTSKA